MAKIIDLKSNPLFEIPPYLNSAQIIAFIRRTTVREPEVPFEDLLAAYQLYLAYIPIDEAFMESWLFLEKYLQKKHLFCKGDVQEIRNLYKEFKMIFPKNWKNEIEIDFIHAYFTCFDAFGSKQNIESFITFLSLFDKKYFDTPDLASQIDPIQKIKIFQRELEQLRKRENNEKDLCKGLKKSLQ